MTTTMKQRQRAQAQTTKALGASAPKPPEPKAGDAIALNTSVAPAPSPNVTPAPTQAPAQQKLPLHSGRAVIQHPLPDKVDGMLVHILSHCRAHDSEGEKQFLAWLRTRLQAYLAGAVESVGKVMGEYLEHSDGAVSLTVFNKDGKSTTTMFCSHIDTCDGRNDKGTKQLDYLADFGTLMLAKDSPGSCLGADDGIGVWLMLKMIEAKVPGTYMFHRGEEVGRSSAKAILDKERPWLSQFEVAVEFDRPGEYEIITHQRGRQECASAKFGQALAAQLNKHGMGYETSDRGVYTDCYEYRTVVAECVNVGVGYTSQHSKMEEVNYAHVEALLKALLKVEWDALPVDRDPKKVEVYTGYQNWNRYPKGYGSYKGTYGSHVVDDEPDVPAHAYTDLDREFAGRFENGKKAVQKPANGPKPVKVGGSRASNLEFDLTVALDEVGEMELDEIQSYCEEDPAWAATTVLALLLELESERAKRRRLMGLLSTV